MKTVILAGLDNLVFTAMDLLDPKELKLVGIATTIEQAWNIYDDGGKVKEEIEEMPIMPLKAAAACEPDGMILVASSEEEDRMLKHMLVRADYRGEVTSLFDLWKGFSLKTAAIRKISWRLEELGVEGAVADLGAYRGDISWQLNALMPERTLYLFDTFTGYDERDVKKEQEGGYSEAKVGEYALTKREYERVEERLLSRMPYPDRVVIRKGWFPETAFELEEETYALVHMDTRLYQPTYGGMQYFWPRMNKGGVIVLSGYEDGKQEGVRQAMRDLEEKYGAFLMTPLADMEGSVMIIHP